MSLKTKNVFLTGGAQGLGKGYTESLLELGARVVFADQNASTGAATERELQDKYGADRVKFVQCDVTDADHFEGAFKTAQEFLGFVDLFVNNAGLLNESLWERMIQVNFTALVRGTLMAVEHMRTDHGGKGGRVINISSQFGLYGGSQTPIYSATKHAVRAITTCLAEGPYFESQGVEYGCLCPGPAQTELLTGLDSDKCRGYQSELYKNIIENHSASVSRIQEGFLKLVLLQRMNGAIMFVSKNEKQFVTVNKTDLGDSLV